MKRSPLLRHTPIRSRSKLNCRTTLRRGKHLRARSARQRRRQATWSVVTRAAIAAVNGRCQIRVPGICTGRARHGHHKLPRGRGGKDTIDNCVPGCPECHQFAHDHPDWARAAGVLE